MMHWLFKQRLTLPQNILLVILSLVVSFLPGVFGSVFTATSVSDWYVLLEKPFISPPSWIFAPVWTFLYFLMGIALYRIALLGLDRPEVRSATKLFLVHLVVNGMWSYLFFGLQSPLFGLAGIVLLWGFVAFLITRFLDLDIKATWLMMPYFAWVSFALVLNYQIWILNLA